MTQATEPADNDQRHTSGSICILCRLCARLGIAHVCITEPGPIDSLLIEASQEDVAEALGTLLAHPARPLNEVGERRGVPASWCFCQHRAAGTAVAGPSKAG